MRKRSKLTTSSSSDVEFIPTKPSNGDKIDLESDDENDSFVTSDHNSDSLSDSESKAAMTSESNSDSKIGSEFEISSDSDSVSDTKMKLEPDTASNSQSDTSEPSEAEYESSFTSDLGSEDNDPSEEIEKIIGMDRPEFPEDDEDLFFYVKYKNKSYLACEWVTKDNLTSTKRGKALLTKFEQFLTPFRKVPFYNQINAEIPLYKPSSIEFEKGFIIPEKILSIQRKFRERRYLIKWLSLDISESTWETDVSDQLIADYEENNKSTHPALFKMEDEDDRHFEPISESPSYKNDNRLTDYQIQGLNFLLFCWFQKRNSILADEMGLGKTIESISILVSLSRMYPSWGPFLVVCPLSTVPNWLDEFEQWTDFRVACLMGEKKSRQMMKQYLFFHHIDGKNKLDRKKIIFDVLVVSYEWLAREFQFIKQFNFMYTIIDEAQKIKNSKSNIFQYCMKIPTCHFLLMTGTPIQNNLSELWSLLHFIAPKKFDNYDDFISEYEVRGDPDKIVKLQMLIQPYLFRRNKNDVNLKLPEKEETIIEVEMTQIQRTFSKIILKDNIDILSDMSTYKTNLNNVMMQLRKLFCHPFLFAQLESLCLSQYREKNNIPESTPLTNEDEIKSLVMASGKTILIDKLLPKLKEGNHKVLIFSQMTRMLDIIEDYLVYKQYNYERLDGSCSTARRKLSIEKFQNDDDAFIFLLSTRAGGLGINLTKADTVIIYDCDWNPQNDIQAQSRAHRIGQTKKVNVYRLITRGCYESEMFTRASKKLALDYAILDSNSSGSFDLYNRRPHISKAQEREQARAELQLILRKGAYYTFNDDPNEIDKFCSEDIDKILEHRSHLRKDIVTGGNSRFKHISFDANQGNEDAEVLRSDFWKKLDNSKNIPDDYLDIDLDSGIQTRPKTQIKTKITETKPKKTKKKNSSDESNSSSYSSDISYSYYTESDDDFVPGSQKNNDDDEDEREFEKVHEEEDDDDDLPPPEPDDDVIYVTTKKSKSPSFDYSKAKQNQAVDRLSLIANQVLDRQLGPYKAKPQPIPTYRPVQTIPLSVIGPIHYKSMTASNIDSNQNVTNDFILKNSLNILRKHGISGARLVFSEYMQEICKSLMAVLIQRIGKLNVNFSVEKNKAISFYVNQHISNLSEQIEKVDFSEFKDENYIRKLFNGDEIKILEDAINYDILYRTGLYLSHEKLPTKFQFAPEMQTPIGWTPIHDFIGITASLLYDDYSSILNDEKLPFETMKFYPNIKDWLRSRYRLIFYEITKFVPSSFCVYDKIEKVKNKEFENIESFVKNNYHVVYPERLSISFQKKIIRLLYLYGIPQNDGLGKIENILGVKSDTPTSKSLNIFIHKILNKCKKYENKIEEIIDTLPKVERKELKSIENVDVEWIKEEAIESLSSNIFIIYKVRNYYFKYITKNEDLNLKNFQNIPLCECPYIKNRISWWSLKCDIILFKIVAFYGFLFNSVFLLFIRPNNISHSMIGDIRAKETISLTPDTTNSSLVFLGPALNLEYKKRRIIEIVKSIEEAQITV